MKLLTRSNLMVGFLVIIVLCVIGWGGVAFASGGTTLGEFGNFSLGIEAESVLEREMEFEKATWSETVYWNAGGSDSDSGTVDSDDLDCNFESNRVLLSLGIGLHSRLDLTLKVGVADAKLADFDDYESGEIEFDGDSGAAYGFGLKAKLFEVAKFNFITTAEYLRYKVDSDATEDGVSAWDEIWNPGDTSTGSAEMEVVEWEVALTISKEFGWFTPYAGVGYSDSDVVTSLNIDYLYSNGDRVVDDVDYKWEQEDNVAVLFGADAELGENFSMGLACKLMSEKSVAFQMVYKF